MTIRNLVAAKKGVEYAADGYLFSQLYQYYECLELYSNLIIGFIRIYYHRNPCVSLSTTVVGKPCWRNEATEVTLTSLIRRTLLAHEHYTISISVHVQSYVVATMMTNY